MRYLKTIGFGAILWAAIFVIISILVALKATSPWLSYPLGWIVSIVLAWYFAKILQVKGISDGLITGLLFIFAAAILDYFITTKFTGMSLFKSWNIWVGYGLTILTPTIYGIYNKEK